MARKVKRLSARSTVTIGKPGRHADGDGLYLVVDRSGAKRWVFMFRWAGKLKEMGLGGLSSVPLLEARVKADDARRAIAAGRNPIAERRQARAASAAAKTFWPFAETLIEDLSHGFRNAKHRTQWTSTLQAYAGTLHEKPLSEINTSDILAILQPIWRTKPEKASRVRGRIERVLDAAKAKGLRSGENPARWRGHLDQLLPKRQRLSRGHHAAMAIDDTREFMRDLRAGQGIAERALEFTILTAARSNETIGARWAEIDLDQRLWTLPAERMKGGREHRVPLSNPVVAILKEMAAVRQSEFVFPSRKPGRPLSVRAFDMTLTRMNVAVTTHGFRSTFRDWASERTSFAPEVCEMALAHVISNRSEAAYRRGELLEKRRQLMNAWASFCASADILARL